MTALWFISLLCCFSPSFLSLSSHQCPLLDAHKHGWVDCWQRRPTKSCVNTLARTLAHHGLLIHWLMASFSTIHPSTSHPSLLSPSVLTFPPSFSSLCTLSFTAEWRNYQGRGNITITTAPVFFSPATPNSSTRFATIIPLFILKYFFILLCFDNRSFTLSLSFHSSCCWLGIS